MLKRLATIAAVWAMGTGTASAVFSIGPAPASEPATTALLVGGALAVCGIRYLKRRKGNRRDR